MKKIADSEPKKNQPDSLAPRVDAFVGESRVPGVPSRLKPKVCIVGFADGHRDLAPWDSDEHEFWGINRLHIVLPDRRFDRWFELHSLEDFYSSDDHADHREWLTRFGGPIYIRSRDLDVAAEWGIEAEAYPLEAVLNEFETSYFNNTVSYLLALAIVMGFEEIHMYGVDMAQDTLFQAEYRQQRPSCEYFIGVANGRGIPVKLPDGSDLMVTSHLYGFEDDQHQKKMVARMQELSNRKEQMRAEMQRHEHEAGSAATLGSELEGALRNTLNALQLQYPAPGQTLVELIADLRTLELPEEAVAGLDATDAMIVRKAELEAAHVQHQAAAQFYQARISELDGAMQEVQYNLRNLSTPIMEHEE